MPHRPTTNVALQHRNTATPQPRDMDPAKSASLLLALPLELFHLVLVEAIRVRGLKRAFRLRLVSRE